MEEEDREKWWRALVTFRGKLFEANYATILTKLMCIRPTFRRLIGDWNSELTVHVRESSSTCSTDVDSITWRDG